MRNEIKKTTIEELKEKLKELQEYEKELSNLISSVEEKEVIGFEDDPIFLLSIEEYEKYRGEIPLVRCLWWLRSPGYNSDDTTRVYNNGFINYYGQNISDNHDGVRPAVRISDLKSFTKWYDKIFALGATWIKIDDDLAIAEMPIMFSRFDTKSNDYETSEIRQKLLEWYEERTN